MYAVCASVCCLLRFNQKSRARIVEVVELEEQGLERVESLVVNRDTR